MTVVLTEEFRQGSAQYVVPDRTNLCDSWPRQAVQDPKVDEGDVPAGKPVQMVVDEAGEEPIEQKSEKKVFGNAYLVGE